MSSAPRHVLAGASVLFVILPVFAAQQRSESETGRVEGSGDHIEKGEPKPLHSYFFSIGDWGTAGCEEAFKQGNSGLRADGHKACVGLTGVQVRVAEVMGRVARGLKPSAIVSLGDNFYINGVKDLNDPHFKHSFENIYTDDGLKGVPWMILLGDHDHLGNVSAQMKYGDVNSIWRLPSPYYSFNVSVPGGDGRVVEIIMADSMGLEGGVPPEVVKSRRFHGRFDPKYTGAEAGAQHWKWLENKLEVKEKEKKKMWMCCLPRRSKRKRAETTYAARVVVAHRPVVSAGIRGRTAADLAVAERLNHLLTDAAERTPILYLHGHDHFMQVWKDTSRNLVHAGNGAGSAPLQSVTNVTRNGQQNMKLEWASNRQNGFVVHELGGEALTSYFVDASDDGKVVYSVRLPLASA